MIDILKILYSRNLLRRFIIDYSELIQDEKHTYK